MNENCDVNIAILTCWWTIDKDYSIDKWSYYFTFWEPAVKKILDGTTIRTNNEIDIIELMQKDSLDMELADRLIIKNKISSIPNKQILITHWTDTMIDTWKILKEVAEDRVIILVWSSIPENFRNTDAHMNIWFAFWALKFLYANKKYWVYIAMNLDCFKIDNVVKNNDWIFTKIN